MKPFRAQHQNFHTLKMWAKEYGLLIRGNAEQGYFLVDDVTTHILAAPAPMTLEQIHAHLRDLDKLEET